GKQPGGGFVAGKGPHPGPLPPCRRGRRKRGRKPELPPTSPYLQPISSTPPAARGRPEGLYAADQSAGVARSQPVLQDVRLPRTLQAEDSLRSRPFPRPCPERFALFPAASQPATPRPAGLPAGADPLTWLHRRHNSFAPRQGRLCRGTSPQPDLLCPLN